MSCNTNRRNVAHVESLAKQSLSSHEIMEHVAESGVYESWLCMRDRDSAYWFRITHLPKEQSLMITGDLGTMVWQRCEDMVAWIRGAAQSLDYFAEKVSAGKTRTYSKEAAEEEIKNAIAELTANESSHPDNQIAVELQAILDAGLDDSPPDVVRQAMYDSRAFDGSDFPSCEVWDFQFLWRWMAIRRWLELLDAGKTAERDAAVAT